MINLGLTVCFWDGIRLWVPGGQVIVADKEAWELNVFRHP